MATTAMPLCSATYWRVPIAVADQATHTRDAEQELDHDRATDERADLETGDGQQREARRPERVTPEHPSIGDALGLGHEDVVLLQRLDHVAAQQPHVHGDLTHRQA